MLDTAPFLEGLNNEQAAAVQHGNGPLMIIAGAGTGKTQVITRRIAWLIATEAAKSDEILALTFTEKAANEMEERVDRLLPLGYLDLNISTFHAFCEKVLHAHGMHIGLPEDFKVLTEVEAWLLMRRHLKRFQLDYFKPRGNPTKFIKAMLTHFSRAKDEGITPEAYQAFVEDLIAKKSGGSPEVFAGMQDEDKLELQKWQELAGAYATYEKILLEQGMIDFGGLLLYVKQLFTERPNVLAEYRKKFVHVIVDEFQDTNTIQYDIVKLLASPRNNITIVGDDDQAIYRFRGAALANILQFRSDFPDTARVVLTQNYRSGQKVLDASYGLIVNNNPHRLEASEGISKQLQSNVEHEGFVHHIHAKTLEEEIEAVVQEMTTRVVAGDATWQDFALLSRSNDATEPFLEAFDRNGIPFRFVALSGLYSKPIILDALAWMRAVSDPHNGTALYRVLAHPKLGLAEKDLMELLHFSRKKGYGLHTAMRKAMESTALSMEAKTRVMDLEQLLHGLREKVTRRPVTEMFVRIIKETGLMDELQDLPEPEQEEIFGYLDAFMNRLKRYVVANPDHKELRHFLEEFDAEREAGEGGSLRQDDEEGPDVVSVLTVHAAKGLEFRYVFVVNLIEQRFPSTSRSEALPLPPGLARAVKELDDHVAEERRLFYVAMTRAKEGLFLMSAEDYGGTRARKPSRFLKEIGFDAGEKKVGKTERKKKPAGEELSAPAVNGLRASNLERSPYKLPKRFSFSQIAAFDACPQQYKYAHILKVPTLGRFQLSFGHSMHGVLDKFMRRILDQQTAQQVDLFGAKQAKIELPALAEVLRNYEEKFIDEWYESEEQRDEYKELGRKSLMQIYADTERELPKPRYLEQDFTLKIQDILMKGRIDRIDEVEGGYEIIDYKTGTPKTTLDTAAKRQLIIYALAAEECFEPPLNVVRVTYHYLTDNSKVSFTPSQKEKDAVKQLIIDCVARMRESDFTATPDVMTCKYCDFKEICPFAKT